MMKWMETPKTAAVAATPNVASRMPGFATSCKSERVVRNPPSNRMKMSRMSAICFVIFASLNWTRLNPSFPTRIPTARNTIKTGTPILSEIFVAKIEATISSAKRKSIAPKIQKRTAFETVRNSNSDEIFLELVVSFVGDVL